MSTTGAAAESSWVVSHFCEAPSRMNADARVKAGPPAANDAFQWFTPGRFAALLGVLLVVAFPAVVTGQRTFVFGDYGLFGYPLAYYHRRRGAALESAE